jgi:uncharacterized damage-inducible protein DinB
VISPEYVRLMARYNRWQNDSLYREAGLLSDEVRRHERGAFFGSIHGTLSHLLWGDSIWMHRFSGSERPPGGIGESPYLIKDWEALATRRANLDGQILSWAENLRQDWLDGTMTWVTNSRNSEMTRPNWVLVTHFFNHQTHHRGQVHAMLTAAGAKPDATDLVFMADRMAR